MLFKEDKVKATYLQIRVRQDEKDALKEMAKKYDLTLTDFIKKHLNDKFYIEDGLLIRK